MQLSLLVKKGLSIIQYIVIFIPAIVYFAVVSRYAENIPSVDDFDAILAFMCRYKHAQGADKFFMLFEQMNEHRIFSSRVVYVLYDALAGGINFRNLIFIGNLELLLTFVILVAFIKKAIPRYWFVASLVAGITLFDLNNWENANFATGSIQNFGIIFLFSATMFFYNEKGKWQSALAVILHITCTFSSGNGLVASAFLLLFNIFNSNKLNIYLAIGVFLSCSPLYFLHYTRVAETTVIAPASHIIQYFFQFASNHIYYDNNNMLSVAVGVLIVGGVILLVPLSRKLRIREGAAPLIFLLGFLLASMSLISTFRSNFGFYIPSRYLLYPNMLLALLFIFILLKVSDKIAKPIAIGFTLLLIVTYNMNFRGSIDQLKKLQTAIESPELDYPDKKRANTVLTESCELRIYCLRKR